MGRPEGNGHQSEKAVKRRKLVLLLQLPVQRAGLPLPAQRHKGPGQRLHCPHCEPSAVASDGFHFLRRQPRVQVPPVQRLSHIHVCSRRLWTVSSTE
ncbi:Voltage-Dependent L-Type Calcium Channel Subunit Alpha-1S [Manis pentadactyla]|nr:Voltage-Dependent L-Type Calcium Channel Subunit Alpha-1S [Manis pentadactyla]